MPATIGNVTTISNAQAVTHAGAHNNNGNTVVLVVSSDTSGEISGTPTYNGVGMTLAESSANSTRKTWIYYLDDAASGSNTASITLTSDAHARVRVFSIVDALASSLGATGSQASAGATSRSVTLASSSNSVAIGSLILDNTPGAVAPNNTTESDDVDISSTSNKAWSGYLAGDGGSITLNPSWVNSVSCALSCAEFLGVAPPSPSARNRSKRHLLGMM